MLPGHDLFDLYVQLNDVDDLPGVLLLHIGGYGQVIILLADLAVGHQAGEVLPVLPLGEGVQNGLDVLLCQLVAVGHLDALLAGIDEQGGVVRFGLFQHHDASGNGGAEEQVVRQLDHAVDEVVVDEILADLLLRSAPVHDPGEADDGGGAVGGQPAQGVHDEGQIRLGLGGKHACGGETGVVDEGGVAVSLPLDGVGRVGNDDLKGFFIPMLGVHKGVPVGDVELVVVDVMQEHIDPAEVIGGDIDLLPVEALTHLIPAQDLGGLQQ